MNLPNTEPGAEISRRISKPVQLGDVVVGGDAKITVQSMTTTRPDNVDATLEQIRVLQIAGCEIIRVAVPDESCAKALGTIRKQITIPLVADIHFKHVLALEALEQGIDGLRINPGNIGSKKRIKEVVTRAKSNNVPIRIGVNAGSLEKDLLQKYGVGPRALCESALRHVRILEDLGFDQIKLSVKASNVLDTVQAYRLLAKQVPYPLHLGITEAGVLFDGSIKSAIGIGALLLDGIGDTIRVSLAADPADEIRVGFKILRALGLRKNAINVIACPSCGRCDSDHIPLANRVSKKLSEIKSNLNVAIMGCEVNGPGEAREADVGLAAGKNGGLIFRRGKLLKKVKPDQMEQALLEEVHRLLDEQGVTHD